MLVQDRAAGVLSDSRFEHAALVAVDPTQLEAILVQLELFAEDALLLIDDRQSEAWQPVVHRVEAAVLDEFGDVIRVDLGTDTAKLKVRAGAEVLADQAYDSMSVTTRARADRVAFEDDHALAGLGEEVGDGAADHPSANHHRVGGVLRRR